jgi:hypothetical protein
MLSPVQISWLFATYPLVPVRANVYKDKRNTEIRIQGMAKKRKPGGGRKPNPNKKVMFSTRLEPHVMAALKAAAAKWPGGNVSTFTEFLINKGLHERDEEERDPPLRALLFLIGQLAEHISGTAYTKGLLADEFRHKTMSRWRSDRFKFLAFRFAVNHLLNSLGEPHGRLKSPRSERTVEIQVKTFAPDDAALAKIIREQVTSPEAYGVFTAASLIQMGRGTMGPDKDKRFLAAVRQAMSSAPEVLRAWERDWYGLPQALHDLELKPKANPRGKAND